jgi:4'-phosphopantetheinyl transferase
MLRVWAIDLARRAELAQRSNVLADSERRRAAAFRRARDRDRYLVAHVAVRLILGRILQLPAARVPISPESCPMCGGGHGRPALPAGYGLWFSLSRAADLAVFAVADVEVGVDVELVPADDVAAAVTWALHPRELADLERIRPADRSRAVAGCWVRKEALLKARGTGLAIDPRQVDVGLRAPDISPVRTLDGFRLADFEPTAGYLGAVAVASRSPDLRGDGGDDVADRVAGRQFAEHPIAGGAEPGGAVERGHLGRGRPEQPGGGEQPRGQ